ncbi:PREDICTED: PRAME family member 9/15-like [Chinchilla lanigera]|uniref:PRAME family member 9/15-like n=1 Tax=Chinchilla lanigera TaxID=34839 RepID=UPI000697D9F3|nr:PREDICTED: PRAME family member 9/15-like [Chinchilla lanigera]
MSTQHPQTLQKLAIQSLLRDKALAMEAVEHLPSALFPPVFMEAFTRGHIEVLKAMVLAWPFPCLPLGSLMEMRTPGTLDTVKNVHQMKESVLQAVLEGIHMLLSQKVCSRRLKLQVLDMRAVHQNFWTVWAENKLQACSSEAMKRRKTRKSLPRVAKKQPLKVIVDLWIMNDRLDPVEGYLLKWVQEMENRVHLECPKLRMMGLCTERVTKILRKLNLYSVQEMHLSQDDWNQLPQSEQTRQLKSMGLIRIRLTDFSPEPLQILLDNVAATLTTLHLENCGITDAQVCAFLPSLSCCSQLTTFCFIRNFISIGTMKKLLCHTAKLRNLNRELYSAPQEVYVPRDGTLQQMWNEWVKLKGEAGASDGDWQRIREALAIAGPPGRALQMGRRLKLKVLDMRNVHQNFWRVWAENKLDTCFSEAMKRRRIEMSVPRQGKTQPLQVIVDLWIGQECLCPVRSGFFKWVQEREDLLQLDCKKLCITAKCFQAVTESLEMLNLGSVQELDVHHCWTLSTLAHFAPFLGQMKNLHKLILSDIPVPPIISPERREQLVNQITSQFLTLHCLREVYMDSVSFLKDHLDQVLRSHEEEKNRDECPSAGKNTAPAGGVMGIKHYSPPQEFSTEQRQLAWGPVCNSAHCHVAPPAPGTLILGTHQAGSERAGRPVLPTHGSAPGAILLGTYEAGSQLVGTPVLPACDSA